MSLFYKLARNVSRATGEGSWPARSVRSVTELILRGLYGRHGLKWSINDVPCRIDPRYRAQMHPQYDTNLAKFLMPRIRPGQVCLDVGANIGAWVLQFAYAVGPTGKVFAFEPNPAAREVLLRHVKLNRLESIVEVVPLAVGAAPGHVELFAAGADGMTRVGEANPLVADKARQVTVEIVRLDDWCRARGVCPDWLFLDVEGFERHALAGAREIIKERGAELGIVLETHASLWPASGTSAEELAEEITGLGRRPIALSGQTDIYADYGHLLLEPLQAT